MRYEKTVNILWRFYDHFKRFVSCTYHMRWQLIDTYGVSSENTNRVTHNLGPLIWTRWKRYAAHVGYSPGFTYKPSILYHALVPPLPLTPLKCSSFSSGLLQFVETVLQCFRCVSHRNWNGRSMYGVTIQIANHTFGLWIGTLRPEFKYEMV